MNKVRDSTREKVSRDIVRKVKSIYKWLKQEGKWRIEGIVGEMQVILKVWEPGGFEDWGGEFLEVWPQ